MALTPQYKTQEEVPEGMREHYTEVKRADGSATWRLQVEGEGWSVANTKSILDDLSAQKASVVSLTGERDAAQKQLTEAQAALEKAKQAPSAREGELETAVTNAKQQIDALQTRLDSMFLDHKLTSAFVQRLTPDPAASNGNGSSDLLGTFSPLDMLRAKIRDRIRLDRAEDGTETVTVLKEAGGDPATRLGEDGITPVAITLGDLMDAAFQSEQFKRVLPAAIASPTNQPPQSGLQGEPTITKTDAELVAQIGR